MTCLAALTDSVVLTMFNTGTPAQRIDARAELFKRAILPPPKKREKPEPKYARWGKSDWQERQWAR